MLRSSAAVLFRSYVFSGDREKARLYAGVLKDYYLERGGWDGVQVFLEDLPSRSLRELDRLIHPGAEGESAFSSEELRSLMAERIVLGDGQGEIVADTTGTLLGTRHPLRHMEGGIPVVARSRRVGSVLVGSMIDSSLTDAAEAFLSAMTGTFVAATFLSAAAALLLSVLFTLRIRRALEALSEGVRRIGEGRLEDLIRVGGRDELSELAGAFNRMAEELRRQEEAKRRVIADAAHELRTPVALIRGMVEGMLDGVLPADAATLRSVHEETVRLSLLIDTLRELELMESGSLELDREPVDPCELAERTLRRHAAAAADKGVALSFERAPAPGAIISADPHRLVQVLDNLLSNALRHTPPGGRVLLSVSVPAEGGAVFCVEDSGSGIAEEERERVFERFYRVDKSRSAGSGGRGLGLAIARELVAAHGGSIRVERSKLGGALFIVTLP